MPDLTVQNKNYIKQGGNDQVIASGGRILCESGGTIETPEIGNQNVVGYSPVVHRVTVADGATADVDTVLTYKTRILDVLVIKTVAAGGASDTITVKNAGNAISNAISINIADQTTARATTIDDANYEIAAGGTLRVTRTKVSGNNVACEVVIYGIRVA
jgi:hypothetical protein